MEGEAGLERFPDLFSSTGRLEGLVAATVLPELDEDDAAMGCAEAAAADLVAGRDLKKDEGEVGVDEQVISKYSMVALNNGGIEVVASQNARIAVIGGEKFPTRYIEWNFVSSSKERIEKAKEDWENGKFPKVPGDEEEFIPLP